ncbi:MULTISPECIES: type II TA system antitoxin MqsA family protein [Tepidanaerobacter]|uniref:type II TA system antitoxin MqsA family protein n=1 Tax=Tepidanaerobacter TaxID=499228 RepID=UPI000A8B4D82|nr:MULTISPECIES: type II TA system antitoxin MqsA family protein [Tepidanaerobacter]
MKKFCYVCGKEQDTKIITKEEVSIIRGEEIKSESHIRICSFCKEELFDEELDEENIQRTYYIYRKKYEILSQDEIKEVREQYGLSQRLFAKLLNIR